MAGGGTQAGCSLAGCYAMAVMIIFCGSLTLAFLGFGGESSAFDSKSDAGGKLTATIEGTVTELTVKGKTIKIPATKGKSAQEEYLKGMTFSSQCNATEEKWYITMRWPYVKWAWNGRSAYVDAATTRTKPLYATKRVIVYNPKSKKSVVTAICESGPAPWAGSGRSSDNPPDYWTGYHQFDPPEAVGRVAGLAPAAFDAIDANQNIQLEYGFAEDQTLPLGLMK